jgi:hypothetical protein
MNDIIKKKLEKSGLYIAYENEAVTNKELEFFAELIIRECVDIAYTAEPYQAGDLILKHFDLE